MRFPGLPLLLLLLSGAAGSAAEVHAYTVRLRAHADGSGRAEAVVSVSGCAPGTLNLPLGFSSEEDLRLEQAPAGVRLEPGPRNGMTLLRFHFPEGAPERADLRFSFRLPQVFQAVRPLPGEKRSLPAGSRLFRHAFVNTQESPIGLYRMELLFPEGCMAQAVREQLPRPSKSEVAPRVSLARLEGRQAAVLQLANLHQGDDTSMAVEVVPERRHVGWIVGGVALIALYLVYFRDLVRKNRTSA